MDILVKLIAVALWIAVMLAVVIALDKKLARLGSLRWQVLARSLLYAVAFTPTAYHHAPNTIVAPLHLSTLCGNLFYGGEYTASMFLYGVALPVSFGWLLVAVALLLRRVPRMQ